jgi:hypothetical protein
VSFLAAIKPDERIFLTEIRILCAGEASLRERFEYVKVDDSIRRVPGSRTSSQ